MIKYALIIVIIVIATFCKRRTDIKITVFNPYIQDHVRNANITITELHQSNFFTSGWGKKYDKHKEIASGYTDENGVVLFENEKLRMNSKYDYQLKLEESYGEQNKNFDPNSYQDLKKGKSNDIVICDYTKGTVNIQFNDLFVPAQPGDSICILPHWFELFDPVKSSYIKGEGIQNIYLSYDLMNTLPGNYAINGNPDNACGKVLLTIRKRKQGILTIDTMTVQFYPKQTRVIPVKW